MLPEEQSHALGIQELHIAKIKGNILTILG